MNKGEAFEKDRRSRGCPYKTANKWRLPKERRQIAVGCSREHASKLTRFDLNSRKVGKYAAMEKTLFARFKARRAKARKTTSKWLVHMAKHIMRIDYPSLATEFKGSPGWQIRFKKRWQIVTRKKTNVKNTTWEETEPKLQAYFRSYRRRLREPAWWDWMCAQQPAHESDADAIARALAQRIVATVVAAVTPTEPAADYPAEPAEEPAYAAPLEWWYCGAEGELQGDARVKQTARLGNRVESQMGGEETLVGSELQTNNGSLLMLTVRNAEGKETTRSSKYFRIIGCPAANIAIDASLRRSPRKRRREEAGVDVASEYDGDHLPWWKRGRGKWGKYLPWQRFNVDQVPLPFICDMDYTLEMKGAKRVAINQLSAALSKRQCTAQICFRGEIPPPPPPSESAEVKAAYRKHLMEQPPPCLIMRGTGTKISQSEHDAYPPELLVLWQPKAWADRPTSVDWVKKGFSQVIEADKAAGVADESTRYLMIADNLDSQDASRNPPYITALDACQTDDHKVPAGKTDEVQPVDDGLGRQVKIGIGVEENDWLEDDENLSKWENNELTASDRRILLAHWFVRALKKAVESRACRKYFEHTGALLTADGTEDELIKLEGIPKGHKFTWEDDAVPLPQGPAVRLTDAEVDAEPADESPAVGDAFARAETDEAGDNILDDEDDADEEDAPPAPCLAPEGFFIAEAPPPAIQLAFSKTPSPANELVGKSILFKWPVVGWSVGVIKSRNYDARSYRKVDGERCNVNFHIYYEIDDQTVPTVLRLDEYDGQDENSWVLLHEDAA